MSEYRPLEAAESGNPFFTQTLQQHLQPSREADLDTSVLNRFDTVFHSVPAYRTFLQEHGVDPAEIQTLDDYRTLPVVTKHNYILRNPLPDLCRNGRLQSCDMVAVSSGSTGTPCFWPRSQEDEWEIAWRFEQVFYDSFHADERTTLAVICFALGTWVGGMYTAACCRHLARKGYPITVVTPGANREEIFRVVQELGPLCDQVVLCGYPPFLKDLIDLGRARGVDWPRYAIKLVMAGEVFSEEWRSLVAERVGSTDPLRDSAALYGTADAGVLGCETPLSIAIRRFLAAEPQAARTLFGESRLPTLVQYDPFSRFFEVQEGTLLFSGDNGIPLIRYNILDTGGILSYDRMVAFLADYGFDPHTALDGGRGARRLPFVYVFGRSDFTVSYFGANVYPENVSVGLEQSGVRDWVTGKFVLQAVEDSERDLFLSVVVELVAGVASDERKRTAITESILAALLALNSEFAHYVPTERRLPHVTLASTGDPEYFPAGVKHRYTRRSSV